MDMVANVSSHHHCLLLTLTPSLNKVTDAARVNNPALISKCMVSAIQLTANSLLTFEVIQVGVNVGHCEKREGDNATFLEVQGLYKVH